MVFTLFNEEYEAGAQHNLGITRVCFKGLVKGERSLKGTTWKVPLFNGLYETFSPHPKRFSFINLSFVCCRIIASGASGARGRDNKMQSHADEIRALIRLQANETIFILVNILKIHLILV